MLRAFAFAVALAITNLVGVIARSQDLLPSATPPEALRRIEKHKDWTWSVAVSPDDWRLLSCSGDPDHTARVWDYATGKEIRRLDLPKGLYDAVWLPDGRRALVAGTEGVITLWDAQSEIALARLKGHTKPVRALDVKRDGRVAASGSEDGTARIWDLAKEVEMLKLEVSAEEGVYSVAFSPDGRKLLTGDGGGVVCLWDLLTGREVSRIEGHEDVVWSVAFHPDGRRAVSGSGDGTIRIWDLATGRELRRYDESVDDVYHVAFSPDGSRLVAGTSSVSVPIWDVASGKRLHTIVVKTGGTLDLAFTADGSQLAGGCGDGSIWVASLPDRLPGEFPRPKTNTSSKDRRKGR
jgi:WD40 repeat protein